MALQKDFLWGGALAAHQFEGGVLNTSKGYSVADVMTAGAHGVPREITDGVVEGKYYPNHVGIDFYGHYKEDIAMFVTPSFRCAAGLRFLRHEHCPDKTAPDFDRQFPARCRPPNREDTRYRRLYCAHSSVGSIVKAAAWCRNRNTSARWNRHFGLLRSQNKSTPRWFPAV